MASLAPRDGGRPKLFVASHMSKEPRLAGKVCIISGASRGFGQASEYGARNRVC